MYPQQLDSLQSLFWPQGHNDGKHSQEPAQQWNLNQEFQDKHINTGTDTPDHDSKLVLLAYLQVVLIVYVSIQTLAVRVVR